MIRNWCLRQDRIEEAVLKICDFIDSQEKKVKHWKEYSEKDLWFELVSCILGSRVRYEVAKACAMHLRKAGLLDINKLLRHPEKIENKIRKELNRPIYPPFSRGNGSKYRYPVSRARYIVNAGIQIYKKDNSTIKDILKRCHDGLQAREVLMEKCPGIGPKQASLFLRNIGFCDSLAILDSHVLRYMELLKLRKRFGDIISKKHGRYFMDENILKIYAANKRKSLATLDMGIWIVMRLIQKGVRL